MASQPAAPIGVGCNAARPSQAAGHCVRDVVMGAGPVIDQLLARPRRPPFQAAKLVDEPRVIQQRDLATIDQRQERQIEVRFWIGGLLAADALRVKSLHHPLGRRICPI